MWNVCPECLLCFNAINLLIISVMFLIQTLFWYFLLDLSTAIPQGFLCWRYTRKHYKNSCIENTKNWWGLIVCPAPVAARALYCLVYFYNKILGDIFFFIFGTSRLATLSTLFFILNSVDVNLCLLTNLRPMFPFLYTVWKITQPRVFWSLQGIYKGKIGVKWVNTKYLLILSALLLL